MTSVLVACHNPTTDGELIWEGHTIVAYVDITPVIHTQEERKRLIDAELDEIEDEIRRAQDELKKEEDEEEIAGLNKHLEYLNERVEDAMDRYDENIDVERLSKQYYQGWDAVPKDLKVDIIYTAFCPLGSLENQAISSLKTGVQKDIFGQAVEFLKPGGKIILTIESTRRQPFLERVFSIQYGQTLPTYPASVSGEEDYETPVMILTKRTGGRLARRKTRKAKRSTRSKRHSAH